MKSSDGTTTETVLPLTVAADVSRCTGVRKPSLSMMMISGEEVTIEPWLIATLRLRVRRAVFGVNESVAYVMVALEALARRHASTHVASDDIMREVENHVLSVK